MSISEATCWTVIRGAAAGEGEQRAEFARRYEGVIRAYLGARWRGSGLTGELEDAVQDVFVDCFKGALNRADPDRPFQAFLYGITKNVARRIEHDRKRAGLRLESSFELPSAERTLSEVFDEAWARALMKQAAIVQRLEARDEQARQRIELLRLRFQEGLPIRKIAERWGADAAKLHHEYAHARDEFRQALQQVVAEHHSGQPGEIARECARLISLFS